MSAITKHHESKDDQDNQDSKIGKDNQDKLLKQNNLYKNILLEEYVYLKATDINKKIDEIILHKLKSKIEGKCIKVGYVIPDSIKIQTRSMGIINNSNFDGLTTYKIKYTADVCNPTIGQIVDCQVENIDKYQVICYVDVPDKSPLEIYLFKQHHVGNTDYAALKKGDIIKVKIGGNNWSYRDTQIVSIAQFVSNT